MCRQKCGTGSHLWSMLLSVLKSLLYLLWSLIHSCRQHDVLQVTSACNLSSVLTAWYKWRAVKNRQLHIGGFDSLKKRCCELDSPTIHPIHIQASHRFCVSHLSYLLHSSRWQIFCSLISLKKFLYVSCLFCAHVTFRLKTTTAPFLGLLPD